MNEEELDGFEELNIDLQDIDDLDIGLEIISYKVRKNLQELADIIINQSCQISTYKDKEDRLREELLIWGEVMNPKLQNKLLQILNEGDK